MKSLDSFISLDAVQRWTFLKKLPKYCLVKQTASSAAWVQIPAPEIFSIKKLKHLFKKIK